jgi:hypothetical protein
MADHGRFPRLPRHVALAKLAERGGIDAQPAERLAFVLHDMFAVSFDEVASIVGRSTETASSGSLSVPSMR